MAKKKNGNKYVAKILQESKKLLPIMFELFPLNFALFQVLSFL